MVWRRLPSFLPNFPIRLLPFTEAQQKEFEASGHLRTVAFRTIPSLSKVRWSRPAHVHMPATGRRIVPAATLGLAPGS